MRIFGLNIFTDDQLSKYRERCGYPEQIVASYQDRYERHQTTIDELTHVIAKEQDKHAQLYASLLREKESLSSENDRLSKGQERHEQELKEEQDRYRNLQESYTSLLRENEHLNAEIQRLAEARLVLDAIDTIKGVVFRGKGGGV